MDTFDFDPNKPFELYQWPEMQEFLAQAKIEVSSGTERGSVLICGSMIEELCKRLLRSYLISCRTTERLLKNDGPIGTFSASSMLLYSLGAITKQEFQAIDIIRDIRNHFAHSINPKFDDKIIIDKCEKLHNYTAIIKEETISSYDVSAFYRISYHISLFLVYRIQQQVPLPEGWKGSDQRS